jgi:hypothetical protein
LKDKIILSFLSFVRLVMKVKRNDLGTVFAEATKESFTEWQTPK